ncbi:MAG: DUF3604 domain-containing protein [Deltaproteobacteria bacterium]|nr:DUF3604 domain-containing protein [Deltaproteobacteria bacterium]
MEGPRHALRALALISCCLLAGLALTPSEAKAEEEPGAGEQLPARAGEHSAAAEAEPAPAARPYTPSEERELCSDYDPLRKAYFGDLHVHTTFSFDASTQGTRNDPHDAYRFARGAALGIQPYDREGEPLRELRLLRPLDFAAVTDHAELLGETHICTTPGAVGHGSLACLLYRWWPRGAFFLINHRASSRKPRFDFCGEGGESCLEAAALPWRVTQESAEAAYDRSAACRFSSFVAYEWTGADPELFNTHRNVIFRNAEVPRLPPSFIEIYNGRELSGELSRLCTEPGRGCDFLVIPHNSNLSGGSIFESTLPDGTPLRRADAELQARNEPLIEIMQHKGDSECLLGAGGSADEYCDFELLPYASFRGKFMSWQATPPESKSFVRDALLQGLALEQRIGANPFKYGIIASTDSHLGTPGNVREDSHQGHGGAGALDPDGLPKGLPEDLENNPGGLAVVWAEENSRDSLFNAMQRRETYGTSGPRIQLRFFASWHYPDDLCASGSFVEEGYAGGVPMGGDLPPRPAAAGPPAFAVWALRDPGPAGRPGTPLQQVQIVKGWIEGGQRHEKIFEVAGDADNGASVDLRSCEPRGRGADSLCTVWRDPEFRSDQRAFYYARVLENPSCRWSAYVCNANQVDCSEPDEVAPEFQTCCSPEHHWSIQERAWSSPIWYRPENRVGAAAEQPGS